MILAIGDLHAKEHLSYNNYIDRDAERQEILDFIVDQSKDCESVVFLGDVFDKKDPPATVTRDVANLFERFKGKQLFAIAGNHSKKSNGESSSLDFLREIGDKHWRIFTKPQASIEIQGRTVDFLPFMRKGELDVENDEEATMEVMDHLSTADILFAHHAVSDTLANGTETNIFNEIVLPKKRLEEKYKLILAGHIHTPGVYGKTIITGSVFNCDMGETEKYVWKINPKDLSVEQIKLPGRGIYKLVDPTVGQIREIPTGNIVKVILTDKNVDITTIKDELKPFDASLVVEQYPNVREKVHFEDGALDLDVVSLLNVYAQTKKVDVNLLQAGYSLIQ